MFLSKLIVVLFFLLLMIDRSMTITTTFYQNDYEPRVFDHLPLNCYDCLSYRDIILTQLTDVPARSFAHFNLGSRDTFMILNGHVKLNLHPYAFQSLIVQKPNRTLTITFAAPNSWLNITENTFAGLDLREYSTLRIVIKFFYGCTFHKYSLSGIKMEKGSRLIVDISSLTEVDFENNLTREDDWNSSVEFLLSRTETIVFDPHSFSSLIVRSQESLSFQLEFISHILFKSHSFQSLELQKLSALNFHAVFITRLTIESFAFDNLSLDSNSIFNVTIKTMGTCLCFPSNSFQSFHTRLHSENIRVLFRFYSLRGLSFLSDAFNNFSLHHRSNRLEFHSINPFNDRNSIVNFASNAFSSRTSGSILFNFSQIHLLRFERNSLKIKSIRGEIVFKEIVFVDLSTIELNQFDLHFDQIHFVRWPKNVSHEKTSDFDSSVNRFHFNELFNQSCVVYGAPRSIPWLFAFTNQTKCNCPLLYAVKHGQLDGQSIGCLQSMSGIEMAAQIDRCRFEHLEQQCLRTVQSLSHLNQTDDETLEQLISIDFDPILLRYFYDRTYLSCSLNYSIFNSSIVNRSRFLDNVGLAIGIILGVFLLLLIIVMALLNGLQYKMRECDESWTWRRNMSWTTLRRTLSQTSLRRSRRDLRTIHSEGVTSKSDNELDRLRSNPSENNDVDDDDDDIKTHLKQSQSIGENFN